MDRTKTFPRTCTRTSIQKEPINSINNEYKKGHTSVCPCKISESQELKKKIQKVSKGWELEWQ